MQKERGFTLVELLAAIVLMGLIASLATYSVRIVFDGNIKSYTTQFATALRIARDQSMTAHTGINSVTLGYDAAEEVCYYTHTKQGNIVERVVFKKDVKVSKETVGGRMPFTGPNVTFTFDEGTGKTTGESGTYWFTNAVTNSELCVHIVEQTGSVIIDE